MLNTTRLSKEWCDKSIMAVCFIMDKVSKGTKQLHHSRNGKEDIKYILPTNMGLFRQGELSHPVLEGKPNANHVRARIRNSRTQQLHNWTSSHNAQSK
jgi:hypothetical protein